MGVGLAFARAPALHDSYSWTFSVEFSLAAVFSFSSRDLRGRSVAPATGITDRGYSGAGSHRRYGHCDANAANDWIVRFPSDVDLSWARGRFGIFGRSRCAILNFRNGHLWRSRFRRCSRHIIYIPTNCGVPTYNFSQELLKPAPLDPARLYLSIYPWAELTYCVSNKPQPVGEVLRPGSTLDVGRTAFHQWL